MRLLLIRHGQTPSNVAGALDTAFPGAGLTLLGELQAKAVPQALAHERIAGVYASPLIRTQLTAAPLADATRQAVHVRDGLEEISAGALEMRADEDAVEVYASSLATWMRGDLDHRIPGGPSGHDFVARYDAAIRSIAEDHAAEDTVAVFSHGAAIRGYTALRAGLHPDVATELRIMNTGMAALQGGPDSGWRLERFSSEPLGGLGLEDRAARDVTGESADEAAHHG